MLISLLVGLPVLILCLLLQGVVVTVALRQYARFKVRLPASPSAWVDIVVLSTVMLVTLLGNFVQMAVWAVLFVVLGEFDDFQTALYHSGVNFATLGYGDIVMSERWRTLGPLEAANGILMFGVSTSVMIAAVIDVVKANVARRAQSGPGAPLP